MLQYNIFLQIQLSFLYVGHTHEDIDQVFSTIADILRVEEAMTLDSLMAKMPNAEQLNDCFDIVAWMNNCLLPVQQHTKTGMFRFRKSKNTQGLVDIFYRKNSDQKWRVIKGGIFKKVNGKAALPKGKPPVLQPSLEKIDINLLRQHLQKWKNYFDDPSPLNWWNTFLQKTERMNDPRRQALIWTLDNIPPYKAAALADEQDALDAIPENVAVLLAAEEDNPVVSI